MQVHEDFGVERHRVSDEALMAAVRDGDIDRLGELFNRHGSMFYRYFVRLAGNEDTGWDLVQEMFLRMLKYRQSYRELGRFRSWAFQIAHNVWNDHHRRHEREVPLESIGRELAASSVLPLTELEKAQEMRLFREAFAVLPAQQRELLVLSHFERVPYAEIADALSCSVGAVKVRVHRAVKELRNILLTRLEKRKRHEP